MSSATDFLQKPIFLHGLSGSFHLVLLLAFVVSWAWKKVMLGAMDGPKEKFRNTPYTKAVFCSLGVSTVNLILCLVNYFYSYRIGWSDEKLMTLSDLAFKTVAWGTVYVYLNTGFFNSGERRLPLFFRVWCAFYLFISCYCCVVDIIQYEKHASLPIQYFISDAVSSIVGFIFCCVGLFVKDEDENGFLHEPLLNGNTNVGDGLESNKTKADETVTVLHLTQMLEFSAFLLSLGWSSDCCWQ